MTFDVPNLVGKIIIGYEVLDTEWVKSIDYDVDAIYLNIILNFISINQRHEIASDF